MRQRFFSATFVIFLAGAAHAEPLAPGMRLPEIRLADQHDVEGSIGGDIRVILFTRDMDAGGFVKEALAEKGDEVLAAAGAVYVSDISGMPRVIAKLFAVPSMRKRPYRMFLDRDGKTTADFPSQEGKVTLLHVENGEIRSIECVESAEQVRALLTPAVESVR
jgi:hypothetical protein